MLFIKLSQIQLGKTRFSSKILISKMLKVQILAISYVWHAKLRKKSLIQFLIFAYLSFSPGFFKI